ncbi:hypothetical protein CBL_13842 [Carabus blaptoides fortunei]
MDTPERAITPDIVRAEVERESDVTTEVDREPKAQTEVYDDVFGIRIPDRAIIPDIILSESESDQTIKTFNGEGDGDQAKQWIDNISSMQTLHSWPDSFVLETARTHLVGGAKHWYTARAQELRDWAEFRSKFKKAFVGEISMTSK